MHRFAPFVPIPCPLGWLIDPAVRHADSRLDPQEYGNSDLERGIQTMQIEWLAFVVAMLALLVQAVRLGVSIGRRSGD